MVRTCEGKKKEARHEENVNEWDMERERPKKK